ncbi:MAG TPA: hypothetical protein ENN07_01040 [candidate division Zixibacteria bacterium]|nr:hypothetical protein [candidate division Zixibacteria bacterium]
MMKRNLIYAIGICLSFAGSAWAIFVGNPSRETPFEQFGMSAEFNYERWMIRYQVGPNYRINSQRVLLKPTLGVFRYVDAYGYLGWGDVNFPSVRTALTDFDGSPEMAFGLGIRTHFADFYPDFCCKNLTSHPVRIYAVTHWLTTQSSDKVVLSGGVQHYEDRYRFQQWDIGLYGNWQFGRTIPYLGIKWTYLYGRKYRKAFSGESGEPYARLTGLYNDPGQYPKPILGLDIDLGKGYVLSLETSYWGKDETSIGIGLSQLYRPRRLENEEEQAIQRPD